MEPLRLESEPTAVFVRPTVGDQTGNALSTLGPGQFEVHDRAEYYRSTRLQEIQFEIARQVVAARCDPRELGHEEYVRLMVERLVAAIRPDDSQGEPPLLPILNRYKPLGTTAEVDFKTTRSCHETERSHINQVVLDTQTWERSTVFQLEQGRDLVAFYARNDHLGLVIPYEYLGVSHSYEPDFLVRLNDGRTLILETKGYGPDEANAKHAAAKRWCSAVNTWGQLGQWDFHVCRDPRMLSRELRHLFGAQASSIA